MIALYLLGMTFLGALGGLMLKKVSTVSGGSTKLVFFILGCAFYGLGAILNVLALKLAPYTVVFPLSSVTYIWTFVFSYFYLKESLNRYKLIGLSLILLGATVIVL